MPVIRKHVVKGPAASRPSDDYESLKKGELVALAKSRDLPSTGTKADLVQRLRESDEV